MPKSRSVFTMMRSRRSRFFCSYACKAVCYLQLLDLPGIIEGAKDGKGRGKQVIAVARTCNIIFICLDVLKPLGHKKILENELEGFGIRLNKKPPNISFRRKEKGGVNLNMTVGSSKHSFIWRFSALLTRNTMIYR